MTPKQVVEIIEYLEEMKQLPELLATLSEEEKTIVLAKMEARKAELGL